MSTENQNPNQPTTEIPPQQVVSKLGRLAVLLTDVKRMADEYWEAYNEKVSLGVSGTNWYERIEVQCGDYSAELSLGDVYLFLRTPNGGYRIFQHGDGSVGDVLSVPMECWDALIKAVEDVIRRGVDKIERMRRFYHVYTGTF